MNYSYFVNPLSQAPFKPNNTIPRQPVSEYASKTVIREPSQRYASNDPQTRGVTPPQFSKPYAPAHTLTPNIRPQQNKENVQQGQRSHNKTPVLMKQPSFHDPPLPLNNYATQFEPIEQKYNQLVQNLSVFEIRPEPALQHQPYLSSSESQPKMKEHQMEAPKPSVYQLDHEQNNWQMIRQELSLKEGQILKLTQMMEQKDNEISRLNQIIGGQQQKANHILEQQLSKELNEKENIINDLSVSLCQSKNRISALEQELQKHQSVDPNVQFFQVQRLMQNHVILSAENERLHCLVQELESPNLHYQEEAQQVIHSLTKENNFLKSELRSHRNGDTTLIQDMQDQLYFLRCENRRLNEIVMKRCTY